MRTKGTPKTGGRIKGSNNKITSDLKVKMTDFLNGNMEAFVKAYNSIDDPMQRAKIYLEAYKTVMPKPKEEDSVEQKDQLQSEFMKRLFPNRD